jgi:hypothetical protein
MIKSNQFSPVLAQGDFRSSPGELAQPCLRGIYGDTAECRAEFSIQIMKCNSCDCIPNAAQGLNGADELVKMTNGHTLVTDVDGCKPWFALADASMRSYISTFRKQIMDEIMPEFEALRTSCRAANGITGARKKRKK